MLIPAIVYYIIFCYLPMYGVIIAFKDYSYTKGIIGSDWVGLAQFQKALNSAFFWRAFKNTVIISSLKLLVIFPSNLLLAILISETRTVWFKKSVQTISYLPHFMSWIIVGGVLYSLLNVYSGLVNLILTNVFGQDAIVFMQSARWYRTIIVVSDLWKSVGWNSIIYIAAISSLDQTMYEAAIIDGAKRWQRIWHITIPGIMGTTIFLLIMSIGNILNGGFDQTYVLYNPLTYDVGDILDTYVYREGLVNAKWSYTTAVGLFKSVICMILLFVSDRVAKRIGQEGLF